MSPESTMAVKSVKPEEVPEICQFISANTKGLLRTQNKADTIPEFHSARIIYANYVSPQHAKKAAEVTLVECTRRGWGGGRTRAATHDRLSSIKRSPEKVSQVFPMYIAGLPSGNKRQQQFELQQLYSKYGSCWVAVNTSNSHAFINFCTFDSVMAAVNDSSGIRYDDLILKAKPVFETAWTYLVWTELKKASKLSFAVLSKMAEAGVRQESGKLFYPKSFLTSLRCVQQFQVSDAEQHVTWAWIREGLEEVRIGSQEVAQATPPARSPPQPSQSPWSLSLRQSPSLLQSSSPKLRVQDEAGSLETGAGDELSGSTSSWGGDLPQQNDVKPALTLSRNEQGDVGSAGLEETECGTPCKYVCPIGQQLMQDPVRLSNGTAYERCEIEKYLAQGNNVCPLTQVRIDSRCVIPDPQLQAEIARYAQSQRIDIQGSQSCASPHQASLGVPEFAVYAPQFVVPVSAQKMQGEGDGAPGDMLVVMNFNGSGYSIFKIVERLGGGGMGNVYRAARVDTHCPAAIEAMAAGGENGKQMLALKICFPLRDGKRERNEREVVNLRRLQEIKHENVIRMIGSGTSPNGSVVLVMEEISSQLTLKDMMDHWNTFRVQDSLARFAGASNANNMGQPPFDLCMDVLGQMMCGVAAVHTHSIAHRDLKPSNVMLQPLTNKLRVVIIDFGLSKDTGGDHSLTGTGQSLGTTSYMSPEQIGGIVGSETNDMAADVWALGVIAYTMIEGRHPFSNATSVPPRNQAEKSRLILNIQSLPMPSIKINPDPLLQQFLSVVLDKNPDRRFQSATLMQQAFLHLKLGSQRLGEERGEDLGSSSQCAERREEMEQAFLGLKFGSAPDNGESSAAAPSGELASVDSRAASEVKPEQHPTAHPKTQALAGFSRQGTRLSDATVSAVSMLFQRLGGHFASAAQVVEENEVGGEDLKDFLEDEEREHNPLYMSVEQGGLGLGEIQVRKLRRELQKMFAEE